MTNIIASGADAADFTLHATPDQTVTLSDYKGQSLILAFYPADWNPVYGDQMTLYDELLPEFKKHHPDGRNSVDSIWCRAAFAKDRNLHFPLLADFEPKSAVARLYALIAQKASASALCSS